MTNKRHALSVEPRTLMGKKVKQLRRQGFIPANIYGHQIDPTPVTVEERSFSALLRTVGETGLIDLQSDSEKAARPVLVHSLLRHPVTDKVLHIDFLQVNLKEKLVTPVPLEFIGESPLIKNNEAILLELLVEVDVECLPTDIPSSIEVDISSLTTLNQGITVAELTVPAGVEIKTDPTEMVCKLNAPQQAEVEEEEVEEEATEASTAETEEATEE